jgi:hypothetical protein
MSDKPRVMMGMPNYDGTVQIMASVTFLQTGSTETNHVVVERVSSGGSLLARSFNLLWAQALNMARHDKVDYFIMQHADLAPEPGYVDKLIKLIQDNDADVVSVVVPIKDQRGLTSTGLCSMTDRFIPGRRFTMREMTQEGMPLTFSSADVGHPDKALLINTGCFIADVRKEWAQAQDDAGNLLCSFSIDDRIRDIGDQLEVGVEPEDWRFSRYLHANGAKVLATRSIKVLHFGGTAYTNERAWGAWQHDQEAEGRWTSGEDYRIRIASHAGTV